MTEAAPGKWSGAQILEHLLLTYSHTNRGLEKCLQAGGKHCLCGVTREEETLQLLRTYSPLPCPK